MKVTDEMVEAALKAHYSAWGTAKKSQDMYRDAMRAALEAVIPLSDPAAWQWLDTANFRKAIPESSNPSEWNPLYRHPALSHAAGQDGEQCRAAAVSWDGYEAFEQFLAAEIDSAPEALRRLGDWLCNVLDEDHFTTANRMVIGAMMETSAALRALSRGVPDGMVLVPREPTPEMETAHRMYGDTSDWWQAVTSAAIAAQRKEG